MKRVLVSISLKGMICFVVGDTNIFVNVLNTSGGSVTSYKVLVISHGLWSSINKPARIEERCATRPRHTRVGSANTLSGAATLIFEIISPLHIVIEGDIPLELVTVWMNTTRLCLAAQEEVNDVITNNDSETSCVAVDSNHSIYNNEG